jgi:hypothetical protein
MKNFSSITYPESGDAAVPVESTSSLDKMIHLKSPVRDVSTSLNF